MNRILFDSIVSQIKSGVYKASIMREEIIKQSNGTSGVDGVASIEACAFA